MASWVGSSRSDRQTLWGSLAVMGNGFLSATAKGTLSGIEINPVAQACIIYLAMACIALPLSWSFGQRPVNTVHVVGKGRLVVMIFLDSSATVLTYVALQTAPIGPVMALSLTAPVILIIAERRQLSRRSLLAIIAIVSGLALIAINRQDKIDHPYVVIGLSCSLGAAGIYAYGLTLGRRLAQTVQAFSITALLTLGAGLLLSPALVIWGPPVKYLVLFTAVGSAYIVGARLYWVAIKRLTEVKFGSLRLLEPFLGSATAFAVYGVVPSLLQVPSTLLLLGGIYLIFTQSRSRGQNPCPREAVP